MRILASLFLLATLSLAQSSPKLPLIAVMPLSAQGVDDASALVVTDALSDQLLRDGNVRVMERSQMEKILKEQGFNASGVCEGSDCALAMGKLLAIDRMVVGSLGKLGESFTLSVRVVDVATGEVLGSARRMRKGRIDDVIADLLPLVTKDLVFQRGQKSTNTASAANIPQPRSAPEPVGEKPKEGSGRSWIWWTAGSAVVAGGAVAALVLTGKSSSSSSNNAPAETGNNLKFTW